MLRRVRELFAAEATNGYRVLDWTGGHPKHIVDMFSFGPFAVDLCLFCLFFLDFWTGKAGMGLVAKAEPAEKSSIKMG